MTVDTSDYTLLSELLLGMGEAVVVTDDANRIVLFNHAAEDLFGYRSCEIVGQELESLIPEQSRTRHVNLVKEFAASPEHHLCMTGRPDIRCRRKDGGETLISASVAKISHESKSYYIAIVMDRTEDHSLAKAERLLETAQRIAQLGNWDLNIKTGELAWSGEIYRYFGERPKGFGATFEAFLKTVHPEDRDRVARTVDEAVRDERPFLVTHRLVGPDGDTRIVQEQGEMFFDENGTPSHMIGTVQDVTERTDIEEQLRQAQNLQALGRIAGSIAHDFNNMLAVILGNLELLQHQLKNVRSASKLVGEATKAARSGAELTERLLSFSQRQRFHYRTLDLGDAVLGMNSILRRTLGESIDLEVNISDDLWLCETDPGQFENVLLNLTINACDAMPDGGRLTIEAGNATIENEFVVQHPDARTGEYVMLSITDTGHGISKEDQKRMFDPFFTTKGRGRGVGLGLSTVRDFVKQSGGFILWTSEVDAGACFKIYLPKAVVANEGQTRRAAIDNNLH